jgi:hypothetical protein
MDFRLRKSHACHRWTGCRPSRPKLPGILGSWSYVFWALGLTFRGLSPLTAQSWSPHLDSTATWHDNATNADRASDMLEGLQWDTEISGSRRLALAGGAALHFGGRLALEVRSGRVTMDSIAQPSG